MADEAPEASADDGRHETVQERLDRNFDDLLQELRVAQTGVQILFAFLLTVSFAARFGQVHGAGLVVYAATVTCAALATCCLIAPVAFHRLLFRRRAMAMVVAAGHRLALAGLALLAAAIVGSLLLALEVAVGWVPAIILAVAVALVFGWLWLVLPLSFRDDVGRFPDGDGRGGHG